MRYWISLSTCNGAAAIGYKKEINSRIYVHFFVFATGTVVDATSDISTVGVRKGSST